MLLIAPWWIGAQVRALLLDTVQQHLPAQSRGRFTIAELAYEQGLFTSSARYLITLSPVDGVTIPDIDLRTRIQHGPVLIGGGGISLGAARLTFEPQLATESAEKPLSLELNVGFDQQFDLTLKVDPIEQADGDNFISLSGASATAQLRSDDSAAFQLDIGRLILSNTAEDIEMRLASLQIRSQTQRLRDLAPPSNVELSIPVIAASGAIDFQLTDLFASATLTQNPQASDRVNFKQHLRIGELQSNWPLQSLDWHFDFQRMPATLIRGYAALASELGSRIEGGQPVDAAFLQSGLTLASQLLNTDFHMQQSLAMRANGGEHESDLRIRYNGLPDLTNLAYLDLYELIAALEVDLTMSLDLEAVLRSSSANLIDPYVQEGYLTIENGQINLRSSLRDSELTLNGEPKPIEEFF